MPNRFFPALAVVSFLAIAIGPLGMTQGAGCWVQGAGYDEPNTQHPAPGTQSQSQHPAPGTPHPDSSHRTPPSVLSWASPGLVPPNPAVYRGRLDIPSSTEPAAPLNGPVVGDINVLVLIIEFTDMKHDASHGPSHFGNMLFNSTPSVKSVNRYYDENSFGLLSVSGEVTAVWLQSAQTMAYYGADGAGGIDNKNGPIYALVTEAVRAADPLIDFSRFDRDLDGFIDHLCVVHAGQGQEASADRNTIWSHRWYDFDEPQADGVTAGYYTMLSEFSPVGTFAHELGHDMGLPDLYDYGYDSFGAGSWDLMATGSWNDNGNTPAHLSAWCKYRLGWLTPETLVESAPNLTLARIEDNPAAYRLDINPPNEYFLIENRERVGWDAALPGAGLLIWHIDEGRPDNDDQNHRMVDLEEADEAVNGDSPVQATDPWADSPQGFNPSSQPSSSAYSGDQTGYWLYEIGPSGLSMNFSVRTSFTDVAVTALDFNAYSPQNVPLVIGATVTMLSGRAAVPVDVTCTIMRGAVLFAKTEKLSALAGGAPARLQWDWTPSTAGNYIVAVSAAADEDDVRENNVRSGIARIITQLFFDDVENGTGGWEPGVNVPLVPGLWHIVDRSDRYGDARSPTHSWWCGFDATGQYRRGSEFIEYYLESPLIDLTRIQSGVLAFQQKYDISTGLPLGMTKDQGYIEASANLGAGWARLDSITGNGGNWSARYYDITNFTQSLFKFRFVLRSNVLMMGRGWYVDDLSVYAAGNIYDVALGVSPNQSWARPLKPTFFDLTVSNAGNREDSYQLTWTAPESIRVALNATTVRLGLFAGADVRAQVGIAGRAPAGSVLQIAFTATSVGNPKVSSTAVATLVVRQEWLVSLEAESDLLHAGPADNATFRVNLTNPGNGQDSVSLSASGPNGGLVVLAQDRVQLSAWEVHPLEVVLAVPADASAQSELRFCLTARSAGGPEAVLPLRLSVDRTRGVALSAAASVLEARPGGRAIFELIIANRGNGREDFTVTAEMPAGWQASHDVVIALGPFAQMRFSVDVTVPADARGGRTTVVMKASSAGGSPGTVSLGIEVVLPDLYLSGLRIEPQFSDEGRTVTVYVTAGNSGTANATAVIVAVYDNGKRLKDWTADRLAPGQWETLTFKLKLAKGNHMLSAVASTPDRELSSTNNQLSGDAKVRASSSFIPAGGAVLALAALLGAASARFIGRRR